MNTTKPELKPCPFCGGTDIEVQFEWLHCTNIECGATLHNALDEDEISDRWNTRVRQCNDENFDVLIDEQTYSVHPDVAGELLSLHIKILELSAPQWQDISTAPKDGTYVLLAFGPDQSDLYVAHFLGSWVDADGLDFGYGMAEPIMWQPLPTPPVGE